MYFWPIKRVHISAVNTQQQQQIRLIEIPPHVDRITRQQYFLFTQCKVVMLIESHTQWVSASIIDPLTPSKLIIRSTDNWSTIDNWAQYDI